MVRPSLVQMQFRLLHHFAFSPPSVTLNPRFSVPVGLQDQEDSGTMKMLACLEGARTGRPTVRVSTIILPRVKIFKIQVLQIHHVCKVA